MSATANIARGKGVEHTGEEPFSALRRFELRRRVVESCTAVLAYSSGLLALLCIVGIVDHFAHLALRVRSFALVLTCIAAMQFLAWRLWKTIRKRSNLEIARFVERQTGSSLNVLVTYVELACEDAAYRSYLTTRVGQQASEGLLRIEPNRIVPLRMLVQASSLFGVVLLALLALWLYAPSAFAKEVARLLFLAPDVSNAAASSSPAPKTKAAELPLEFRALRVRVVPPAYSGLDAAEFSGDAPIRALINSKVEIGVTGSRMAAGADVTYAGRKVSLRGQDGSSFYGSVTAAASGPIEVGLSAADGQSPSPMVRAIEVIADAPPEAKVTEPTSDQLFRSIPNKPIPIRWEATDDLGLANVSLKFIRSRGEGDAAKFLNGEVAIQASQGVAGKQWSGTVPVDIIRLEGQPGDTFVFWLEARDRNPFATNIGRSGSLMIAIAAPSLQKLELSDLKPNEIGRFLLSERQIIIETEKLHSVRTRLAREELEKRANEIAADQREFKNSFNDFIRVEGEGDADPGTTVEERAEAAAAERTEIHNHGIPEPPAGSPENVRQLTQAIRAMWDAEEALLIADTAKALEFEREALSTLKRAQAAIRYIPPILPKHTPIDLKRRYEGELTEIKTRMERVSRLPESKETGNIRLSLAHAYSGLESLNRAAEAAAGARRQLIARGRDEVRKAADSVISAAGQHSALIAQSAAELRIVESELSRVDSEAGGDQFAGQIDKSRKLLTQAASTLFAIADTKTDAPAGDAAGGEARRDSRVGDYFKRLAGDRR